MTENTMLSPDNFSLLKSVVDGTTSAILVKDESGRYLLINESAQRLFSLSAGEIIGLCDTDLFPSDFCEIADSYDRHVRTTGEMISFEITHPMDAGKEHSPRMLLCLKYPHRHKDGAIQVVVTVLRDITVSHRIQQEREKVVEELLGGAARFRAVVEGLSEGVIVTDFENKILFTNQRMADMVGHQTSDLDGQKVNEVLLPPEKWFESSSRMTRQLQGESETYEIEFRRQDSSCFWAEVRAAPYRDAGGAIIGTISAVTDITDRKRAEERMQWLAYRDDLTGLPNRLLFRDRLEQVLNAARAHQGKAAVLFLDLDRFKNVNDTMGHDAGDGLLRAVAERFDGVLRGNSNGTNSTVTPATIARMGGDEFIALMPAVHTASDAARLATQLLQALRPPVLIPAAPGREFFVSASIGISIFPDDGEDSQTLLKNADIAMYRAKEQGGGTYQLFSSAMNSAAFENLVMEASLRRGLERKEFRLQYQPQADTATGRLNGVEALTRWFHPELGMINPDRFIPIAEATGLIVPLGEWILRTACRDAVQWADREIVVSVNISGKQLQTPGLTDSVIRALKESGLPPRLLTLELTESALISEGAEIAMYRLKALGVSLTVDDFGTGYSSLAYLRQFPLDGLKIDRRFVAGLAGPLGPPGDSLPTAHRILSGGPAADRAVVKAVVDLAHALGLRVTAEGVEKMQQWQELKGLGADSVQGYFISPPLSASDADLYIQENRFLGKG